MVSALDIYVWKALNTVPRSTKLYSITAFSSHCFQEVRELSLFSLRLCNAEHTELPLWQSKEDRIPAAAAWRDGAPCPHHASPTTHSPWPLNQNKQHRQSIWNIFKFINMPRARTRLPGSDERAPAAPFPFFLFIWLDWEQHFHEWTERRQNRARWSRLSVFLWNDVIISIWNLHLSQRRSAPWDSGSSSEFHHKWCGGQAGHRGAGMGEVWFLTRGSAGQGGQTGGQLHFHQHLFTELSPLTRHSQNKQDVTATVQTWAWSSRCSEPASVSESLGGDIQQDTQPVQLATAKVMNKEGLRNSQRPKEIREIGGLHAIWCAGLHPNTGHLWKNWWNSVWNLVNSKVNVSFLVVMNVL